MEQGDGFYTSAEDGAEVALVMKHHCYQCGTDTLCSIPGTSSDNDLESLPSCVDS
jgi:hypothetical protein